MRKVRTSMASKRNKSASSLPEMQESILEQTKDKKQGMKMAIKKKDETVFKYGHKTCPAYFKKWRELKEHLNTKHRNRTKT